MNFSEDLSLPCLPENLPYMSTSDELAASLAEAEGQLAAVEAGLSVDSTSQVPFHLHLANCLPY